MDLRAALEHSNLIEATEAARELAYASAVEFVGEPFTVTDTLGRIYSARAQGLATRSDPHWRRLHKSTLEFSQGLIPYIGQTAQWAKFSATSGGHFLCCQIKINAQVIGCMHVIEGSDLSFSKPSGHE